MPASLCRMNDDNLNDLAAFRKRKAFLDDPANKPIWFNVGPPRFTSLAAETYPLVAALGELAADQSVGPKPVNAQQNSAEENLEADSIIMGGAYSEYCKDAGLIAESQQWDIPDTGWIRVREQTLLDQAKLLQTALEALTVAVPPAGVDHGITAARVATYGGFVDVFDQEIGKPGARRADRKGMTQAIPDRIRVIRGKFQSMEKLVKQFGGTPAGDLFVTGFLNSGDVDDLPGSPGPATPPASPPVTPP